MNNRDCNAELFTSGYDGIFLPQRVFAGLDPPYSNLQQAKTVIIPVPYDSTSEWRTGSRHGPQAIIDASQYLELYDLELDREIYKVGISTLSQIEPLLSSPQDMIDRVYQVIRDLIQKEKFVVLLGGEHSLSLGAVRAFKEAFPTLSVLQLDAHADLRSSYLGSPYNHACALHDVSQNAHLVQVGIRSMDKSEKQYMNRGNCFFASEIVGGESWIDEVTDKLNDRVYVTIDLDVFDPSVLAATGTPEPGGLGWYEVTELLREVFRKKEVLGFDMVELAPIDGDKASPFLAAKLYYKLLSYKFYTHEK